MLSKAHRHQEWEINSPSSPFLIQFAKIWEEWEENYKSDPSSIDVLLDSCEEKGIQIYVSLISRSYEMGCHMISDRPINLDECTISRYDDSGIVTCGHCKNESNMNLWEVGERKIGLCPHCKRYSTVQHKDDDNIYRYNE